MNGARFTIRGRRAFFVAAFSVLAALPAPAAAQPDARSGRLVVTVVDQMGAVIPRATVMLVAQDDASRAATPLSSLTGGTGVASFDGLAEGRYTIQVEFAAFETAVVRDVRVRRGDTRRRVTLQIKKLDEAVTVGRDRRASALDPRGDAFSSILTREQIDALPDDPEELEAALKALAPPGAVIRVDGFTGGRLPPKSQIRSIRIPRMDMFAAQNHGGMQNMVFIDIMTMPGNGPLRGTVDVNFADDALNARNAFTPVAGQEQLRQYNYALSGTIRPNQTSFALNGGVGSQYSSPHLLAVLPGGETTAETMRQPRDTIGVNGRLDHAITKDHALRLSFDRQTSQARNLGVGGYDLFSRAYRSETSTNTLRMSENGPLGRRMFTETRLQVKWGETKARSEVEAPALRVVEAFTSGGAQRRGGQQQIDVEFATDLDYVRGAHSWRMGVLLEGGRYRADDLSNYLGTFTFASLADYEAGRPSNFTRRIGDPRITYSAFQAAVYVQDDYRVSRNVLLSPGLRFGVQSHADDRWNASPRVSAAWSPLRNGSLTLRAGYGYFYEWIASDFFKQSQLVDGERLREWNIRNPSYPDPGEDGPATPTNRYLWSDDLVLPTAHRLNAGLDRVVTKNGRVTLNYSFGWGRDLLRGRNLNAPVDGVRPDAAFANTVALVADAGSRSHVVNVGYNFVRMDWKRTFFFVNYTWTKSETDTTGAFAVPASGDNLETEWGPAPNDVRHRAGASFSMAPITNLSYTLNVRASSGQPYNVTTGRDDNGDGLFNDRPAGMGRNAERGAAQFDVGGRVSYAWGFGARPPGAGGPGGTQIVVGSGGGGLGPGFGGGATDKRFRIEVYVSGQNLLNRVNYTGYSFVMTSPLFGRPVAASQPRKLQVGLRFGF